MEGGWETSYAPSEHLDVGHPSTTMRAYDGVRGLCGLALSVCLFGEHLKVHASVDASFLLYHSVYLGPGNMG